VYLMDSLEAGSSISLKSLILHGCKMEAYMDVFTASFERHPEPANQF
jgi:hypothetical protein